MSIRTPKSNSVDHPGYSGTHTETLSIESIIMTSLVVLKHVAHLKSVLLSQLLVRLKTVVPERRHIVNFTRFHDQADGRIAFSNLFIA